MVILIDSREQRPLVFQQETRIQCLSCGDYGAVFSDTYTHNVFFERKGLGDAFGTLTKGYPRFRKCIERAKEQNIRLIIIIEATRERVLEGYKHSKRNGSSILIQLDTIEKKYGVPTVFCKNRKEMAKYITQFFLAHYKQYQERTIKQGDGNDRKKPEIQSNIIPD